MAKNDKKISLFLVFRVIFLKYVWLDPHDRTVSTLRSSILSVDILSHCLVIRYSLQCDIFAAEKVRQSVRSTYANVIIDYKCKS